MPKGQRRPELLITLHERVTARREKVQGGTARQFRAPGRNVGAGHQQSPEQEEHASTAGELPRRFDREDSWSFCRTTRRRSPFACRNATRLCRSLSGSCD